MRMQADKMVKGQDVGNENLSVLRFCLALLGKAFFVVRVLFVPTDKLRVRQYQAFLP